MIIFVLLTFLMGIVLAYIMRLKNKNEQGNASLVFSTGLSLVLSSSGSTLDSLNYGIAMILNRDGYQEIRNNFNFWIFSLGAVLIIIAVRLLIHSGNKFEILNINAYRNSDFYQYAKDLKLDTFDYKEHDLDFVYLYENSFKVSLDDKVFNTIMEIISNKIIQFKQVNTKKGYTGIAPIPFIMYVGTLLNRVKIHEYYEFDRNEQRYIALSKKRFKHSLFKWNFSNPELKGLDNFQIDNSYKEVVLAISITQPIKEEELVQFQGMERIHIKVEQPVDNLIKTKEQLQGYASSIYQTIEKIGKEYPNIQKIHFVCSSQSCLPFEIGKLFVEGNRIPKVICYHYNRSGQIKYPWGIVQSGDKRGSLVKY